MRWLVAPCLISLCAFAAPRRNAGKGNTQHSEVQDIVDNIVRGESIHPQLARARSMGKEAEVSKRLEEIATRVSEAERLRNIVLALVALRQTSSENTLLRLVQSKDPGTRMYAAQGLGQLKSRTAVPKLISLLGDGSAGVRREAARAIGALRVQAASLQLFETARAETDPEARAAELIAVGQVGGRKQIESLEAVIELDGRESTRRAAARALCAMGEAAGFEYAKKVLASDDPYDRIEGVKLFEDSKAEDATKVLEPLLAGKDVRLAAAAAHTLYTCGNPKMLEWLVVHSAKAALDDRLIFEHELEIIGIADAQRHEILERNDLK